MPTEKVQACLKRLYAHGIDTITFSGGEPLRRPDIEDLLVYAKNLGMRTILGTTGIGLEERLPALAPLIDVLGLPLDSVDPQIHNKLRPTPYEKDHHALVRRLIREVNENYSDIKLSVSSMVCPQNAESVVDVGKLLPHGAIWVVNQFRRSGGPGQKAGLLYHISDEAFDKIAEEGKSRYKHLAKVYTFGRNYDTGCRIINAEQEVLMTTDHGTQKIGKFFDITPDQFKLVYRGG